MPVESVAQIPAGVSRKTGRSYESFWACQIKECKWKPEGTPLAQPRTGIAGFPHVSRAVEAPRPERNFDKEAYEKCCSIWLSSLLATGMPLEEAVNNISTGAFLRVFQAIRQDGDRRFAEGWKKAEAVFQKPLQGEVIPLKVRLKLQTVSSMKHRLSIIYRLIEDIYPVSLSHCEKGGRKYELTNQTIARFFQRMYTRAGGVFK